MKPDDEWYERQARAEEGHDVTAGSETTFAVSREGAARSEAPVRASGEPQEDFTRQFFRKLRSFDWLSAPEAILEEDGDIGCDWFINGGTVSAHVSADGRAGWAALVREHKSSGSFQLPDWPDTFTEALRVLAASPSDAGARPLLKMADVRVGMRLREPRNDFMPLLTVTEITDKGFKYVLDAPYSLGSRLGVTTGGEHYGMDGVCLYELAALSDAGAAPQTPQSSDRAANRVTDELLDLLLDPISGPLVDESAQDFDTIGPMLRRPDIQRFIAGHIAVALETYSGAAPQAAERPQEDGR